MKIHQLIIILFLALPVLGCSHKQKETKVSEIVVKGIEDPKTKLFKAFWKKFSVKFNLLDTARVNEIILDSIWLWSGRVSSKDFIKRYYKGYSKSDLAKVILDTNLTTYHWTGCQPNPPVADAVRDYDQLKGKYRDICNCMNATIKDTSAAYIIAHEITFLETTKGYKLFGIETYKYVPRTEKDPSVDTTVLVH